VTDLRAEQNNRMGLAMGGFRRPYCLGAGFFRQPNTRGAGDARLEPAVIGAESAARLAPNGRQSPAVGNNVQRIILLAMVTRGRVPSTGGGYRARMLFHVSSGLVVCSQAWVAKGRVKCDWGGSCVRARRRSCGGLSGVIIQDGGARGSCWPRCICVLGPRRRSASVEWALRLHHQSSPFISDKRWVAFGALVRQTGLRRVVFGGAQNAR